MIDLQVNGAGGFDLTEAGTQKRLAAYLVGRVADVPGIASLGPDPLADTFTEEDFAAILAAHRMQVKGLLRDQQQLGLDRQLCRDGDFRAVAGRIVRKRLLPQRAHAVEVLAAVNPYGGRDFLHGVSPRAVPASPRAT